VALHFGVYNFVRRHHTLGTTPAVAAGLEEKAWSLEQVAEMTVGLHAPQSGRFCGIVGRVMPTQPESDNDVPRSKGPHTVENAIPQSESHLTDAQLLHWLAECPLALAGLAKKRGDLLRVALRLWQESGCPDLRQWRERCASVSPQERSQDREPLSESACPYGHFTKTDKSSKIGE